MFAGVVSGLKLEVLMKGNMKWVAAFMLIAMTTWGCGSDGAAGEDGAPGKDGEPGQPGEPGKDFVAPAYVGSEACGTCHADHYDSFIKSGHPYKLTKVDGAAPTRPFDDITGGVADPPLGLTWDDITYVIGGFGWKNRYVGADGYIVNGEAGDVTQWNFANDIVGKDEGWVAYHAGEGLRPYNCGSCHTTGWVPCDVGDDSCEHQDGLEGMAGSFFKGGVQCEACHGPGSQHADNPYFVGIKVDRDPEACGKCHRRSDVEDVDAKGGFIKHHEQYEELFGSKKHAMQCVNCHDPHKSAKFADPDVNPEKGIRTACTTCHVGYDENQTSPMANFVNCIDCHMPRLVKSAQGDVDKWTGDIRSHLFFINPDADDSQFTDDGKFANPFISLDFACRSCHRDGGTGNNYTGAELEAEAKGYHSAE